MIKLHETVTDDQHILTAIGSPGGGKSFLLDKIADACSVWAFAVKPSTRAADHILVLHAARRSPRRILPLIENSAAAWGFDVVKLKSGNEAASVLQLQRRAVSELPSRPRGRREGVQR